MRLALLTAAFVLLSGCSTLENLVEVDPEDCATPYKFTYFLTEDHGFTYAEAEEGEAAGNGFVEAFITNDMLEFRGDFGMLLNAYPNAGLYDDDRPLHWVIVGDITVDLYVQSGTAAAPIVSTSDPTTGYHFFNQFGTTQGFAQGYSIVYDDTVTTGATYHHTDTWNLTSHYVEPGDEIRLLLTNLVLDDTSAQSPRILVGGDSASSISFTAHCEPLPAYEQIAEEDFPVSLPLNQGLLTGAIPANPTNQALFDITVEGVNKIQFQLTQQGGEPVKDDVDMTFYNEAGEELWSGGSPYTDEVATLWAPHIDMFDGLIRVEVNGYSSINYEGTLKVTAWQ